MEPGVQQVFEAIVAELVKLCPWMTQEDVGWWREVLLCHFRLVALEEVDLGRMAGALLALAEHARAGGDAGEPGRLSSGMPGRVRHCGVRNTIGLSFRTSWRRCPDALGVGRGVRRRKERWVGGRW